MTPDKTLAKKELDEEQAALEKARAKLTKKDEGAIIQKAQELAKLQEEDDDDENVNLLPKVSLEDVPKKAKDYLLIQEKVENFEVFFRNCFTNEIIYTDLIFQLPNVPVEDLPYVRLLTVLFSQMGCAARDYKANLDYQQANLGGFGASLSLNLQAHDHAQFSPSFHIRGKALFRKTDKLFTLLREMATSIDFTDIPRLKEVILKHYTGLESGLAQNALKYAINKSASGLSVAATVAYDWYGLEYYWTIKKLARISTSMPKRWLQN